MALTDHIRKDSPTNNFATLNPIGEGLSGTMSEGNLKYTTGNAHSSTRGNFYVSSGKWYWEIYIVNITVGSHVGISSIDEVVSTSGNVGNWKKYNAIDYYSYNGNLYYNNTNSSWGDTFAAGDIISVYLNLDANQLSFYKNNTLQASVIDLTSSTYNLGTLTFTTRFDDGSNSNSGDVFVINHGQDSSFAANKTDTAGPYTDANGIGSFYYQPPTGALALCTQNIPTPSIDPAAGNEPEDNFKTVTWTGTNNSTRTITVGTFLPDLIWIKNRTTAVSHTIYDSLRGYGDNKILHSDATNAESAGGTSGYINSTSASNNSFTFGSTGSDLYYTDRTGNNYCAWCWRAGGTPSGATSATGSAKRINTSGTQNDTSCDALASAASATITPTLMSINQQAGFSIVKWVGNNTNNASIPHGLTKTPDFVVFKNTSDTTNWGVKLNPSTISAVSNEQQYLYFNLTNPFGTNTGEETQLTSSIIKFVGTNLNFSNGSGDNMIAYCWHAVPGFSAFGSFTGNNSADGPMIHLGFSPALLICKLYTGTSSADYHSWVIYDNARQTANPNHSPLYANRTHAEGSRGNSSGDSGGDVLFLDFLSNGFKCRQNGTELNGNGGSNDKFIYMAFAEQNFKYTTAR